jgi:hypothetical protein
MKLPVEFHLIALSCSLSRLSKAVTVVTNVNRTSSHSMEGRLDGGSRFRFKRFSMLPGRSNSARLRYSNNSGARIH